MGSHFDFSIIIPAKDEEKRLPVFLGELIPYCLKSEYTYEIIVVDDGSVDQTSQKCAAFQAEFPNLTIVRHAHNTGKGYAVAQGFLKAKGKMVLFLDADGSTPPQEIEENCHFFDEGFDIVIGSRVLHDQHHQTKTKWYRKAIGYIFNFLVHHLLIQNIQDTQCGFKMFKKETVIPIFSRLKIQEFAFDLEVLYLAQLLGYKVKETPVNWHHVAGSKIHLVKDSFKMFLDIFKVRRLHNTKSIYEPVLPSSQEL